MDSHQRLWSHLVCQARKSSAQERQGQSMISLSGPPAILRRRELVALAISTILLFDMVEDVRFFGPAVLLFWVIGIVTFLLPTALVTQWFMQHLQGSRSFYPQVERFLGPMLGFLLLFGTWCPGILVLGGILSGLLALLSHTLSPWFHTPLGQTTFLLGVLWISGGIACFPLRLLMFLLPWFCLVICALYLFLGGTALWWLLTNHLSDHSLQTGDWLLDASVSPALHEILFALLGIYFPLFLLESIQGGRAGIQRASSYVWWAAAIVSLCYLSATFGLLVLPQSLVNGTLLSAADAITAVLGSQFGLLFRWLQAFTYLVFTISLLGLSSRLLVMLAQHHRFPRSLARLNASGVPARSILVQVAGATLILLLSFFVLPLLFEEAVEPRGTVQRISHVLLASSSVLWLGATSVLLSFPLLVLFHRHQRARQLHRKDVLLSLCAFIGILVSFIGIFGTLFNSWIPQLISDQRWSALILLVVLTTIALGWIASESPRLRTFLSELQARMEQERWLRQQLEESYGHQERLLREMERLYHEQARAALTDPITGLPNHRALMSMLDDVFVQAHSDSCSCALLFVDLDHFKQINDRWGHRVGDEVLRQVGQRLCEALRTHDFVGRYGGEEFVVLLLEVQQQEALELAERLRLLFVQQPCTSHVQRDTTAIPVTVSIGISYTTSLSHKTRDQLLEAADAAMYQAKLSGRNSVYMVIC